MNHIPIIFPSMPASSHTLDFSYSYSHSTIALLFPAISVLPVLSILYSAFSAADVTAIRSFDSCLPSCAKSIICWH